MKIETAGPFVDVVVYPLAKGKCDRQERISARKCSSDLRQKANDRTAAAKLKRLIACNFKPQDLVVTLTYDDKTLPNTAELAREQYFKPFIKRFRRELRKAQGVEIRYIYVIEGLHGDKRLHHHMIVPDYPDIRAIIRDQWPHGYSDFERIGARGYEEWARYLTKEPRKTGRRYVGDRMWTPSIGLTKPEVVTYEVPDQYKYEPPPGVVITNNESWQTQWWCCQYVSFYTTEVHGGDEEDDKNGKVDDSE